ncbi:MAG TPA: hypothetical protein VGM77_07835 [Gemmatimonadales bacterium]
MIRYSRIARHLLPVAGLLALALGACVRLGMTLPYDDPQPEPQGSRIRPTLGWLAVGKEGGPLRAPDGSLAIDVVHINGHTLLQQVRHFQDDKTSWGDSTLLDRQTLRPVETWRWTPAGTYVTSYNHRVVERVFKPVHGSAQRSSEIVDVEPYSGLGIELVVASLPLSDSYKAMVPVVVDTSARGWSWLNIQVERELAVSERSDVKPRQEWIVDCDLGTERIRMFIAVEGRLVRKMQWLDHDNTVLSETRRMLLGLPAHNAE